MFLALREARRTIGRFSLLTGAVALLVVLLLFFQAVAGALTLGLTGGAENNQAEVFVYSDSARGNPAGSFLDPSMPAQVTSVPGVRAAAGVGRSIFAPDRGGDEVTVIGLIDPDLGGPAELIEGRRATASGEAVASTPSLGGEAIAIGDRISIEGVEIEVVGIADDASYDVSTNYYVLFEDLGAMLSASTGAEVVAPISWVAVLAEHDTTSSEVAEAITTSIDGVEGYTRSGAASALPGGSQITQSFTILYGLLFLVIAIVTGVFFLILTVQKQDSLVLLRSLGASSGDVIKPVLMQVVGVVATGSLLGVLIAGGVLWVSRNSFGPSLDPSTTAASVAFILLLGLVSGLASVRRVLAIDPVKATRLGGE